MFRQGRWITALTCAVLLTGTSIAADAPTNPEEVYGSRIQSTAGATSSSPPVERSSSQAVDGFRYWNQVAIDASGLDHTPVTAVETRKFGEQLGPGRSSRAIAIVHIAIFDAVNSIVGGYQSYTRLPRATVPAAIDAAIAAAAHGTLIRMFPSQKPRFDALYVADLQRSSARSSREKAAGILIGRVAAARILQLRANDGSAGADPRMGEEWIPNAMAGHWRQDPIGLAPIAMGAHWGKVKPFVLRSAAQFRVLPPPAMTSAEYTRAYDEAKALGGDGVHTPTSRTTEQTKIGVYWAYDGTPSLCAPPRLYNQLTTEISRNVTDVLELARLYALVNVSMADAGIAIWESKYYYDTWRPVTGIRESDEGTGPQGLGDGNPATVGDPGFFPLGAPASNLLGPGFTPPFPSYPSGHAGFGGALFETLRNVYRTDRVAFTFTSDEYNGVTAGSDGVVRPLVPRSFRSFSQAEEENGQSRIYLGIHWSFDKTQGIRQGRQVADFVFANAFKRTK
ncbi:MAG TPA: hypothetical protein VFS58_10005 [Steroidobacteraceae bacterium]|nr:hypothetical protein [Steroidobacteraceae bacterium]